MEHIPISKEHWNNTHISTDEYVRQKRIELAQYIKNRKIVYLDTKYWIILRDAVTNKSNQPLDYKLLETVIQLSQNKKCIFPISEDVLIEVVKQENRALVEKIAQTIDKLSEHICLITIEERIKLELLRYTKKVSGTEVHSLHDLAWNKIGFCLGYAIPSNTPFSKEDQTVIQKGFVDQIWNINLVDMLEIVLSGNTTFPLPKDISKPLTKGMRKHADENKSFNQLFLNEISGGLDAYHDLFISLAEHLIYSQNNETFIVDDSTIFQSAVLIQNLVYNAFKNNTQELDLPTMHITAGLHAALRWEKQRGYQANDICDFNHAASALPYCDYFFTEKFLGTMITQKNLAYDELYSCKTAWKITDAYQMLCEINS